MQLLHLRPCSCCTCDHAAAAPAIMHLLRQLPNLAPGGTGTKWVLPPAAAHAAPRPPHCHGMQGGAGGGRGGCTARPVRRHLRCRPCQPRACDAALRPPGGCCCGGPLQRQLGGCRVAVSAVQMGPRSSASSACCATLVLCLPRLCLQPVPFFILSACSTLTLWRAGAPLRPWATRSLVRGQPSIQLAVG